jgi:Flp pilus assembly protein TadG
MRFLTRRMKGQSTVEMAFMLPVLALLLVVVGDFARVFYAAIGVASAARAGVQYGAENYHNGGDTANIEQAALNDGQNISGLSATTSEFCECGGQTVACDPPQCAEPEIFVKVITKATFTPILKYPGLPSSIPLSSTATMEVQQ